MEDIENETLDDYINCDFIPCSIATCECLWSKKDAMLPHCRAGISPVMSEQLLILKEIWSFGMLMMLQKLYVGCRKMRKLKGQKRGCQAIQLIADQAEAFGWGREEMPRVYYGLD